MSDAEPQPGMNINPDGSQPEVTQETAAPGIPVKPAPRFRKHYPKIPATTFIARIGHGDPDQTEHEATRKEWTAFFKKLQKIDGRPIYLPEEPTDAFLDALDKLISGSKLGWGKPTMNGLKPASVHTVFFGQSNDVEVSRSFARLKKGHTLTEENAYEMALLIYLNPEAQRHGVTLSGNDEEKKILLNAMHKVNALNPDGLQIRINNLGMDQKPGSAPDITKDIKEKLISLGEDPQNITQKTIVDYLTANPNEFPGLLEKLGNNPVNATQKQAAAPTSIKNLETHSPVDFGRPTQDLKLKSATRSTFDTLSPADEEAALVQEKINERVGAAIMDALGDSSGTGEQEESSAEKPPRNTNKSKISAEPDTPTENKPAAVSGKPKVRKITVTDDQVRSVVKHIKEEGVTLLTKDVVQDVLKREHSQTKITGGLITAVYNAVVKQAPANKIDLGPQGHPINEIIVSTSPTPDIAHRKTNGGPPVGPT